MTVQNWKEFKDFKRKELNKILSSKEYQELRKQISDTHMSLVSKTIKRKFLWWTWVERTIPDYVGGTIVFSNLDYYYEVQNQMLKGKYPETVEGCLDWLANGRK
jgi:hypothetical protein